MQLHNVQPIHKNKPTMLVGRGGKRGKTSGRGTKGQNARAGRKKRPELRDFIKRLPKLRGRGVNGQKSFGPKAFIINLGDIEKEFAKGASITPQTLLEKKLVITMSGHLPKIKILGAGDITKAVTISGCSVSGSAKEKIEKAGGTVTGAVSFAVAAKEKTAEKTVKTVKPVKVEKKEVKEAVKEAKEVKTAAPKVASKKAPAGKAPVDAKVKA